MNFDSTKHILLKPSILPTKPLILVMTLLLLHGVVHAQDATGMDKYLSFPDRMLAKIQKKSEQYDHQLSKQTEKYLRKLASQEKKLRKELSKTDSVKAQQLFGNSEAEYQRLQQQLANPSADKLHGLYSGHLDSMQTAINFIREPSPQVAELLKSYKDLQSKFNNTDEIKRYLDERKQYLKAQLQNTPVAQEFRKYQEEMYYYKAQLEEYKNAFDDPEKLERQLLDIANRIPSFQSFFGKYSQLAALFPTPDNYGTAQSIAGLQTRADIQNLIGNQISVSGSNGQAMLQQNLGMGQTQLNQLKDRISNLGNAGSDMDVPNFKPNTQKTKTFFQRLEYSTNFQTQHSNYFFPTTTDMALAAGYQINKNSVIGLGASYKLGWGKDIQHVSLSSEGIGLRSYLDVKMKGTFYASGGFEYNYQQPFGSLDQIKYLNTWQQSGLLGVSKIISLKTKFLKKTKMQVLWDFLSYQQIPKNQPVKFRIGYSF